MKIELKKVTVRELTEGYKDSDEEGVVGYSGRLDIRPAFQREFVYNEKQRKAVIDTVLRGFPLNTMYWSKNRDDRYELLDGQQRTLSICQYVNGDFSFGDKFFNNLTSDIREKILGYELMVYVCEGTESEKLEWFRIINIAGEKLTDQELRNATYTGPWLSAAKLHFSKNQCEASKIASDYVTGSPIRQDYLETALKWISNGQIEEYMAKHQHDKNADELWFYFKDVIEWVGRYFPVKRGKLMKGQPWGDLYNKYKDTPLDKDELEAEIQRLLENEEVENKKGIYPYVLTKEEKYLNLRQFDDKIAQRKYEEQKGVCPRCKGEFKIEEMEADHIIPWHKGGKTTYENCQMLCQHCNRTKSGK